MQSTKELFENIFNEFKGSVYGYLVQSVGREDAKDLAQETFIKIFKNIRRYDKGKSTAAWVFTIARNVLYDYLRKYRKQFVTDIKDDDYEDGKPVDLDESIELRNAVNKLEEDRREVIILYYFNGLKYEEIAEVTGCPVNTIKSRLNRAKENLKELLKINK